MARYVFNPYSRKIHNADCRHRGNAQLPWPLYGRLETGACAKCLPDGAPPVPRDTRPVRTR